MTGEFNGLAGMLSRIGRVAARRERGIETGCRLVGAEAAMRDATAPGRSRTPPESAENSRRTTRLQVDVTSGGEGTGVADHDACALLATRMHADRERGEQCDGAEYLKDADRCLRQPSRARSRAAHATDSVRVAVDLDPCLPRLVDDHRVRRPLTSRSIFRAKSDSRCRSGCPNSL